MSKRKRIRGLGNELLAKALQQNSVAQVRYGIQFFMAVARANGLRDTVRLFNQIEKTRFALADRYGRVLANLILSVAGSFNGCRFCGVSHLYAANLDYFDSTGKLLPLDERALVDLFPKPITQFQDLVLEHLESAEFEKERQVLTRFFALQMGTATATQNDELLTRVIDTWNLVNDCTIAFSFDAKPQEICPSAFGPVSNALIARYQAARAETRRS